MRIAFIQATNPIDVQWSAPIGFGYLKSYVELVAPGLADIGLVGTAEEALVMAPEIVGISAFSQDFNEAKRLASRIREGSDALIVLGGKHISALPHTLPAEVDIGVIGEGEITFSSIVQALRSGRRGLREALGQISGIVYRDENGQLKVTEQRELVPDLDSLPMPARGLRLNSRQAPYLFTSRGCPYRCRFCCSAVYWKQYRTHSASRVVQEMRSILEEFPDTNSIMFWDDLFVADRARLRRIVELAESSGLPARAKISCTVRANMVDAELCALLKRLNVASVAFGAESGSNRILSKLKTGVNVETNQRALDVLSAAGISATCSFIVGIPGETEEDLLASYEFILRNTAEGKLAFYDVNVLTPMPGSQVWLDAERQGLVGPQMNWDRLRYFASRQTNVNSLQEWAALRRENRSIYLNESTIPEARLMDLMARYEAAVDVEHRSRNNQLRAKNKREAGLVENGSRGSFCGRTADYRTYLTASDSAIMARGLQCRVDELEMALAEARERLRQQEAELAAAHNLLDRIARGKVMRLMNALHSLRRKWKG